MATGNAVHVDECHSDRIAGITFENWGHGYVLVHDFSYDPLLS